MKSNLKEYQNNNEESIRSSDKSTVLLIILFCVFITLFLWIFVRQKVEDVRFDSEEAKPITGEFTVTVNEEQFSTPLPAAVDAKAGDCIVITKTLSSSDVLGNSLIFYVKQSWVRVFLDGELQVESDRERNLPFPMIPGSYWYFFRLPADYEGKTLQIEILPCFDNYAKELPEIYSGTKASFIYMVLKQGAFSMLVSIPTLILGAGILIMGMCLRHKMIAKRLVRFGLFAIVTSGWSLMESRITQLFYGNMVIASYLLFSCFYLIPVLAVSFLLTFDSISRKKYMRVLFWISAAAFLLIQVLQVLGIAYYIEMVPAAHVLIVLIIAGVLKCYYDLRKKENKNEDAYVYKAIILLGGFCGLDIICYYVNPTGSVGKFSKAGLLVCFLYLGYSAVRQIGEMEAQEARHRLYCELAFKDIMTGLGNRTAFEKRMDELRKKQGELSAIIFIADMNNLKYINDNFGHAKGDEAIIKIGYLLQQSFSKKCNCYRIGGDEFCVIGMDIQEEEFTSAGIKFRQLIEQENRTAEYQFSVACGNYAVDESGIDECFKKADALMYLEKAEYKKNINK